jgi:hypothetical protein
MAVFSKRTIVVFSLRIKHHTLKPTQDYEILKAKNSIWARFDK